MFVSPSHTSFNFKNVENNSEQNILHAQGKTKMTRFATLCGY